MSQTFMNKLRDNGYNALQVVVSLVNDYGYVSGNTITTDTPFYDDDGLSVTYVTGYAGEECHDGTANPDVDFIALVKIKDGEDFYINIRGKYDSWSDTEYFWDAAVVLDSNVKNNITQYRNLYLDGSYSEWADKPVPPITFVKTEERVLNYIELSNGKKVLI